MLQLDQLKVLNPAENHQVIPVKRKLYLQGAWWFKSKQIRD